MTETPAHHGTGTGYATGRPHRVVALDVLRGFALCGILFVNIPWQIITIHMPLTAPSGNRYPTVELLELFVHGRFFPIFSFLFGAGFALFLETAATRARHPRLVLLRRLLFLAALGIAHQQFHPGEALLPYAVIGIAVLLPASWLPRPVILPLAVAAIAGGLIAGGGVLLIPGLFLLGSAAVRFGVIGTLPQRRRSIAMLFLVAVPATVTLTIWQHTTATASYGETVAAAAGLVGAIAYATGLMLALTTRFRNALERVLAPMGRMALTNYVSATLFAITGGKLLGLQHSGRYPAMIVLAAVILIGQSFASRWWLARYRYGPLEWLWRSATWWTWPDNHRDAEPGPALRLPLPRGQGNAASQSRIGRAPSSVDSRAAIAAARAA
jgi:uncharacterized protein